MKAASDIVFPLAIIMSTTITWAGDVKIHEQFAPCNVGSTSSRHSRKNRWRRMQGQDSILSRHDERHATAQR